MVTQGFLSGPSGTNPGNHVLLIETGLMAVVFYDERRDLRHTLSTLLPVALVDMPYLPKH
jgi:hypothetical protein